MLLIAITIWYTEKAREYRKREIVYTTEDDAREKLRECRREGKHAVLSIKNDNYLIYCEKVNEESDF